MTAKDTGLKGLVKLTRAQYGSILHDPDTKYIVTDGETVQEYLGDIPIGGTVPVPSVILSGVPTWIIGGAASGAAAAGTTEEE